jgi:transcriptional regulator with XRE-family HTH domain
MAEQPELETGAVASDAQASTPGAKLRAAREAQGLSIQDVATRTRIAQRQLEAIERDDYSALPGIPYAVGFARAYARSIGLDEVAIAADVRNAVHNSDLGANRYEAFEPADPARVPSRALAWTGCRVHHLAYADADAAHGAADRGRAGEARRCRQARAWCACSSPSGADGRVYGDR